VANSVGTLAAATPSAFLSALTHRSLAQITRMAPHARGACASIASMESQSATRVPSGAVNPDSLRFSAVFRWAPCRAIATESSEPRCSGDGSSPTAEIGKAWQPRGLRGCIGLRVPTSVRMYSKPVSSTNSYAAITTSIGTPNSTGQRRVERGPCNPQPSWVLRRDLGGEGVSVDGPTAGY
jgi:hypothetical protein